MKRTAILAAIALTGAAAHADPVSVATPKAPVTSEAAEAYVARLDKAVKEVCYDAAGPVVGLGIYAYAACLKQTRAEVARKDPTGLFAQRESEGGTAIAAR